MGALELIGVTVWGTCLVTAVTCAITRRRNVARVTIALGLLTLAISSLSIAVGAFLTWNGMSAPGLSRADRQRMLSNGVAEALYNAVLTTLVVVPALVVGRRVIRMPIRGPS